MHKDKEILEFKQLELRQALGLLQEALEEKEKEILDLEEEIYKLDFELSKAEEEKLQIIHEHEKYRNAYYELENLVLAHNNKACWYCSPTEYVKQVFDELKK